MEEWDGADLEFAALDKLEGQDCSSLLSQGMTHGRHAAWSDASHILQTDNPLQGSAHMKHRLHCCHLLLHCCCTKMKKKQATISAGMVHNDHA